MQILFHGTGGPFRIQKRDSVDPAAVWYDLVGALVTEVEPGVYLGLLPMGTEDKAFYRIVGENEVVAELKGWTARLSVSTPANGTHFVKGERPVVTVAILDTWAQGITRSDLSALALYMHGPQEPKLTTTPAELLNVTRDRTKTPHHFVDLRTNPDVKVEGNTLTYVLQPVRDELPGTYTVSLRATLAADAIQQIMKFADVQIGTSVVEQQVVSREKCAACHEGPDSGKMYMHHIDVSARSAVGNWAYDFEPVKSCNACHNNEGYAAFADPSAPGGRRPDPTVLRTHGVHMGSGLKSAFNTNAVNGNFRDYTHVVFPADIRECTACHVDDRWKTSPTQLGCGTCHDNVWFGEENVMPPGMVMHSKGSVDSDTACKACHSPAKVAAYHEVPPPAPTRAVTLELTPPANGKFFAAGESPKLILKVFDTATGNVIDPNTIVEPQVSTNVQPNEYRGANLYVAGPRALTVPVLTTAAANPSPTASTVVNDLRVRVDPAREDPRVARTTEAIEYTLGPISNLTAGTYTAYFEVRPATSVGTISGQDYINFQVGTATLEKLVAGNCLDCHADTRIHETSRNATFGSDLCKVCHDYQHQMPGRTSWTSNQYGFGVSPLSRRVHGIHYGRYVHKPREIQSHDYSHVIFPQDVRNCTKCHNESPSWNEKPSRLACLACHDSDAAVFHGTLTTWDPTPADPWSGDEQETCVVCHGAGSAFSAAKVHAISKPYVPPYPREPAE